MPVAIRPVAMGDVEPLTRLIRDNREFLAPWEPLRAESYFTEEGQARLIGDALSAYAADLMVPLVILDEQEEIVGRMNVNGIMRGAFQSASLGYWVGRKHNGLGIAAQAIAEAKLFAFGALRLHRLQAETLLHNTASQRALAKNGFVRYGMAPRYLKVAGRWQDHLLFQVLNTD